MKRYLLIVLALLCLAGFVAVATLSLWFGRAIKAGVEEVAPQLTQTTVTLQSVDVSFFSGCAQLTGLVIGNPQGYHAPRAVSVGLARACIEPRSIFADPLVVTEITVESPDITVEGVFSGSNLAKIRDHVQASVSSGQKPKGAGAAAAAGGRRFLVKELRLTNGKVHWQMSMGSLGDRSVTLGLPEVRLQDIGRDTGGARADELASAVTTALFDAVKKSLTGTDRPLEKSAEAVKDAAEQVGEAAKNAASKLLEGFK